MNAGEARKSVGRVVGKVLEPVGFVYKRRDEMFVRPSPHGQHIVSVGFWSYSPIYVFSLVPAVRVDAIEAIYHDIASTPEQDGTITASLVVQLWKLAGMEKPVPDLPHPSFGAPFYYTLSSMDSVLAAEGAVERVAVDLMFPFFDANQDVAAVNRAINYDGLDTSNGRILRGVIAANLAGDTNYGEIVARYQKEMEAWPPNDRELLAHAIEYLSAHPH